MLIRLTRLQMAWKVLKGEMNLDNTCGQEHVPPNHTVVTNDRLQALEQATDELKFALGFIAHSQGQTYEAAVVKAIGSEGKK